MAQRLSEAALRIGQDRRDAGERLLSLGIEDVQDRADQQRMAGLFPMVAPLQRTFRVDEDIGDILDIADLVHAAPHLEQRIVARRAGIGRIEQQAVREACAPAGGQLPVLALDVVDDRRAGPAEQRRHDQAHPLARTGRCERHDMLGAVVAKIVTVEPAEDDAAITEQSGRRDVLAGRPASRAIGGEVAGLPRPPDRSKDRGAAPQEAAGRSDRACLVEDDRRIGVEREPPWKDRPRMVDRTIECDEPGRAELRLVGEPSSGPLQSIPAQSTG